MSKIKKYKCAPEDRSKWKCNWLACAGGMGLAGSGWCSFRGEWGNKNCANFISEKNWPAYEKNLLKIRKSLQVIKKTIKQECWSCLGKKCKACHNTGQWEESIYYHIVTDKKGKKYCIDSDFIK